MAENGEGFEILSESPGEIAEERAVKVGMEENRESGGDDHEVPGLDDVKILVVAGLERHADAVQNVSGECCREHLLNFEDNVA